MCCALVQQDLLPSQDNVSYVWVCGDVCMCAFICVCACVCFYTCVCGDVRACLRARECVCVRLCVHAFLCLRVLAFLCTEIIMDKESLSRSHLPLSPAQLTKDRPYRSVSITPGNNSTTLSKLTIALFSTQPLTRSTYEVEKNEGSVSLPPSSERGKGRRRGINLIFGPELQTQHLGAGRGRLQTRLRRRPTERPRR